MNENKITGTVEFCMVITQGLEKSETKYETTGVLFKKQNQHFLFFDEVTFEEGESPTKSRVEFNTNQIRIRRQGSVIMDQLYSLGESVDGYIKTQYGQLDTRVKTHVLSVHVSEDKMEMLLDYDLYVSNERTGNYKLTIVFTKEDV